MSCGACGVKKIFGHPWLRRLDILTILLSLFSSEWTCVTVESTLDRRSNERSRTNSSLTVRFRGGRPQCSRFVSEKKVDRCSRPRRGSGPARHRTVYLGSTLSFNFAGRFADERSRTRACRTMFRLRRDPYRGSLQLDRKETRRAKAVIVRIVERQRLYVTLKKVTAVIHQSIQTLNDTYKSSES